MVLHYDGSFEGYLTAVFLTYRHKDDAAFICGFTEPQLGLVEYLQVTTDEELASRVRLKLEGFSDNLLRRLYYAWLSREADIEQDILAYIRLSVEQQRDVFEQRQINPVRHVLNAAHKVYREIGHYVQFIRFIRVGETIYLADIEPEYDILESLVGSFTDRLEGFRFLIRDKTRRKALVLDQKQFWISYDPVLLAPPTPAPGRYEQLWQTYFTHIAIPERINFNLQTLHVPKRYRKFMTEFT